MQVASFDEIAEYKHPDVVARLQRTTTLNQDEAIELFEDTKQFLYLCSKHPEAMIPTKALDEGWHNFILFTEDYSQFCETYLGRFIHHRPTAPANSVPARQQAAYERTLRIAKSEFTQPLSHNWLASNPTCCESPDGGTTNCQDKVTSK